MIHTVPCSAYGGRIGQATAVATCLEFQDPDTGRWYLAEGSDPSCTLGTGEQPYASDQSGGSLPPGAIALAPDQSGLPFGASSGATSITALIPSAAPSLMSGNVPSPLPIPGLGLTLPANLNWWILGGVAAGLFLLARSG